VALPKTLQGLKVALVHDWLTGEAGAEQVTLSLSRLFPDAPIYTSVRVPERTPSFARLDVRTSFLQRWPLSGRQQLYPHLRPLAFESFDLSGYDVVISSSSAEAKGVIVKPGTLHLCYCHTPTRYYWNDYHAYLERMEFGLLNPFVRRAMPYLTNYLRLWDLAAARRVDQFVANSHEVAARIKKYYGRDSEVINPPVNVGAFTPAKERGDYLLSVGRLVPYKRVDLVVEAATRLGLPLKVAGEGPERRRLEKLAGPSVEFLGRVAQGELPALYAGARAFIFASEEDFGIVPVEALAAGVPVIAYGQGGIKDSVVPGEHGVFFGEQTADSLEEALKNFDPASFDTKKLRARSELFSEAEFQKKVISLLERLLPEPQ
jgi:glycosyltransferase involved in cell wall biosynthesis